MVNGAQGVLIRERWGEKRGLSDLDLVPQGKIKTTIIACMIPLLWVVPILVMPGYANLSLDIAAYSYKN